MMEKGFFTVQEAVDYCGDLHKTLATKFVEDYKNLPQFPEPVNNLVQAYCWGLGQWITGHCLWCFYSERYFGKEGPSIMAHHKVKLLPKKNVLSD
jgi:Delta6-protoilludene synthase